MEILLVSHRFFCHSIGGTEVLTNNIAQTMTRRGHHVVWLAVGEERGISEILFRKCDDGVMEWEISPGFSTSYPLDWASQEETQTRKIQRGIKELKQFFSVIHLFHFARIGLQFLELPFFDQSQVVVTLTDYTCICPDYQLYHWPSNTICSPNVAPSECIECLNQKTGASDVDSWRTRNIEFLNRRASVVYTQTPEQRRLLVESGLRNDRVIEDCASYMIPCKWQKEKPKNDHRFCFGFVGRLSREKGLQIVLSIFRQLHELTGCQLDVYGTVDSESTHLKNLLKLIAETPGVKLYAPVSLSELGSVLQSFDCLIIPSIWLENHPLVLTYALSLGVPVLCSRVPSLWHLRHKKGIHFVEMGDQALWLKAMRRMTQNSKTQSFHLSECLSTMREEFDKFVSRLERVYQFGKRYYDR